ncbi:MAG: glycoside hydrolase family 20 zincin-like fold domain-containing protein [Lachnospiraceae bacterium]
MITIAEITMDGSCPSEVTFYASQLAEQLKKSSGIELLIDRRASGAHKGIVLCMSEGSRNYRENKKEKEAYRLEITPEGATICASEKEGLFNGVQTLRQLIIQYGSSLPCLYIEDYPALSSA